MKAPMDESIHKLIPHREPFLFVDQIIEQGDDWILASKKIEAENAFFKGHFPGKPIMPGVLICEAIFQTGALLMRAISDAPENFIPIVTRINNVKLKRAVRPGDVLQMHAQLTDRAGSAWYLKGKASVAGKTVLTLDFSAMLVEDAE